MLAKLVYNEGTPEERSVVFREQLVVGRLRATEDDIVKCMTIRDPVVSGRHCVVRQSAEGRFFIRDESRNGTRLDGRRLVPNVETELGADALIQIGQHWLRLRVETTAEAENVEEISFIGTVEAPKNETEITVLVGDIAGYTQLNQRFSASIVYASVKRVFAELESVIVAHHGTVKEIQGDAIFAFWERNGDDPEFHIVSACQCALTLDHRVGQLALDPKIWQIPGSKLKMEWALATGPVLISNMAGQLAVVGDCVNYAFRLEKLANARTGPIVVAHATAQEASTRFEFRNLGATRVQGREVEEPIYALRGPRL